jgi:hypothetical protein
VFDRRPNRARRPPGLLVLPKVEVGLVELPHLAGSAPAQITVPSVAEVGVGDRLETPRGVEPCGELVREALVLDEAVVVGQADGLFVETLGVELSPLQARNLGADQCRPVAERCRAILRPDRDQLVMIRQSSKCSDRSSAEASSHAAARARAP